MQSRCSIKIRSCAVLRKIGIPGSRLYSSLKFTGGRAANGNEPVPQGLGVLMRRTEQWSPLVKDIGKGPGRPACPYQPAHHLPRPVPFAPFSHGCPHQQSGLKKEFDFNSIKLSCRNALVPGRLQEVNSSLLMSWATCLIHALSSVPQKAS